MLNSKIIFNSIFIFSIFSSSFALFLEYFLGHMPCKLCIYQRIPYYVIILIGFTNIFSKKYFAYLYLFLVLLLFSELLSSGYHSLVTFEIITYSGCGSANLPSDIVELKEALVSDSLVVDCSNANLEYLGLPLSLYNFLFSSFFLLIIIWNACKKKN